MSVYHFFKKIACLLTVGYLASLLVTAIPWSQAAESTLILRVLAINPSKDKDQEVPLKTYLPSEAKPENVMNRDDFEIGFDPAKSLFYVGKKVTLKPGESYTMEVHLEDIWQVKTEDLDALQNRADVAIKMLEKTSSYDLGKLLYDSVVASLKTIQSRQNTEEPQSPQEHIAAYRLNLKLLDKIQKDLDSLEQFKARSRAQGSAMSGGGNLFGPDSSGGKENPFAVGPWKLIVAIVGFLALLSLGSFVIWQKQLRDMTRVKEINVTPSEERMVLKKSLISKATKDDLTGLFNIGHFKLLLRTELRSAKLRQDKEVSIIMADVDFFKKINDTFGHAAGDEVLRGVAKVFQDKSTNSIVACRYGGEEFVMMLSGHGIEAAEEIAEKIRATVQEKQFLLGESKTAHPVTVSLGVATYNRSESGEELVKRADKALYQAKQTGRNKVLAHKPKLA